MPFCWFLTDLVHRKRRLCHLAAVGVQVASSGQCVMCAELSCVLDVWNSHSVLVLGSHASLHQCAVVMTVLWCSGIGF